jgi:hypothetical protein
VNWLLVILGVIILGTGLLILIKIFPSIGGKAIPVVLLLLGLGLTGIGAMLPLGG